MAVWMGRGVYGLKELSRNGFDVFSVAGLGAGYVFVARQRGLATPLLDVRLFRNRVSRGPAARAQEAGSAAALAETAGELGLAMGVAVLGVAVTRGSAGLVGGLNASAAICAGVVLVVAALVVRLRA